jgi:WD40 repeat protein
MRRSAGALLVVSLVTATSLVGCAGDTRDEGFVAAEAPVKAEGLAPLWRAEDPLGDDIYGLAWSPDGSRIVAVGGNRSALAGHARSFDGATGATGAVTRLEHAAYSAAFTRDGAGVKISQNTFRLGADGSLGSTDEVDRCFGERIVASPDRQSFAFVGPDKSKGVCVSGPRPGGVALDRPLPGDPSSFAGRLTELVAYAPDGTLVVAADALFANPSFYSSSPQILVVGRDMTVTSKVGLEKTPNAANLITGLGVMTPAPGGGERGLVVVGLDDRVYGVRAFDEGGVTVAYRTKSFIRELAVHPTRPLVATAHEDGKVRVVDLARVAAGQPALVAEMQVQTGGRATAVAWSPDGTKLAAAGLGAVTVSTLAP